MGSAQIITSFHLWLTSDFMATLNIYNEVKDFFLLWKKLMVRSNKELGIWTDTNPLSRTL